jgi:peptidoglycan hydrolase-like protein with peptidoglycan-binding domain
MDFQGQRGLPTRRQVDEVAASLLTDPAPNQVIVTSSTFQGLRRGDGITFGTWELRPRVTALQERLTFLGSPCKADGMFGPLTQAALNEFQASRRLPPTDVVDPLTADALDGRSPDPDQPTACPVGEVPVLV